MLTGMGQNNLNKTVFNQKGNFIKIEMIPRKILIFTTFFKEQSQVDTF